LTAAGRPSAALVVAHAQAEHGQAVGQSRDELGFGDTQTGITTGIQYRF